MEEKHETFARMFSDQLLSRLEQEIADSRDLDVLSKKQWWLIEASPPLGKVHGLLV